MKNIVYGLLLMSLMWVVVGVAADREDRAYQIRLEERHVHSIDFPREQHD